MASRILFNDALAIDQTLSGGYIALVLKGTGLIRNTGVQDVSGVKSYYDTTYFYSGVGISGDLTPSGYVIGNLSPKTDNYYNLGAPANQWSNLYIESTARIGSLIVNTNATVTGNLSVTGNSVVTGTFGVGGTTTLYGDFIPTNVATNFLPKTTNTYALGSNSQQFSSLWLGGTGFINELRVVGNSFLTGNLSVLGNETVTGNLTVVGSTTIGQLSTASITAASVSTTGSYGKISGTNLTTTGTSTLGVTTVSSLSSAGSLSTTDSGVFRLIYVTGSGIPTSSTGSGAFGQIVLGSGFLYACTGTNKWGRLALSTF